MKRLFQEIVAFLYHVIDAPESAPETRKVAEELASKVEDVINDNPPPIENRE
jgi:hypothetical protein